ncbi:MAG: phosphomannomutase [Ketobacteraceae bacterium]|nr:phosphomannomutase [Ketobacteraceae bacterium]
MYDLSCFKAYDLRGKVPDQLNSDIANRVGRAFVEVMGAKKVVVGHDIRLSSKALAEALIEGLMAAGADVYDIGLCGTEHIYFSTAHYQMDGGIVVTASHNPKDYNGMKMVGPGSRPLSSDNELMTIKETVNRDFIDAKARGNREALEFMPDYIAHLMSYVNPERLKRLNIVVNAGNGGAGAVIDSLEPHVPFSFIKLHHEPDGNFPNGVPNPLLPENREVTTKAVQASNADFGIAWDGDFDRCFLFDETGRFIEGYYIVGLLAQQFLKSHPGAAIVHDPRLTWNTQEIVLNNGGSPIESKTGHAFIKATMREQDAVYGGEMSAHHYFKKFFYCDSGMIPWLMIAELICETGQTLSSLIDERISLYPASGEINRTIADAPSAISLIESRYNDSAKAISKTDGLSMDFDNWRFNLRMSNTEPLVRLNVESRRDGNLMRAKTEEIIGLLDTVATS